MHAIGRSLPRVQIQSIILLATLHSLATQLFGAQLFSHEKLFPALPRANSVPDDHMPNPNCVMSETY